MIRPSVLAAASSLILAQSHAFARTPLDPCRTKSRQMTLAKNCYSGDMVKPQDGAPQFFTTTTSNTPGVNYCFNSLVEMEHKPGQFKIRVLKESKDGQFHAYEFSLAPTDVKALKKDATLISLKGLKGECFSPTGDREVCSGGFLKTIGLRDTAVPLILGVTKAGSSQYSVSHLAHDPKEISKQKPKELEGVVVQDTAGITSRMIQDIRKRISNLANAKLAVMRSGKSSPKRLSDASAQFRYCTMAFESFLKTQNLSDPFSPAEKVSLNTLTDYMNNDPHFDSNSRMPASSTPVVKSK